MSGLQNVRFTNVRFSKRPVPKIHPCIFYTCDWWKSAGSVAALFAGKVMAVFYSLFQRFFLPYITIMASNKKKWHTLYFK
jgi:hypothetical protein